MAVRFHAESFISIYDRNDWSIAASPWRIKVGGFLIRAIPLFDRLGRITSPLLADTVNQMVQRCHCSSKDAHMLAQSRAQSEPSRVQPVIPPEDSNNTEEKAVGVGFDPTLETSPKPVFKTGAFSRSAIPPGRARFLKNIVDFTAFFGTFEHFYCSMVAPI